MKKIIISFVLLILFYSQWYAVDSKVESAFNKFLRSIELNYSISQQEIVVESLKSKLRTLKYDKKYSERWAVIDDLLSLTHEKIYKTWLSKELSQSSQKIVELRERKAFTPSLTASEFDDSLSGLLSSSRIFLETNNNREFIEWGNIKRITYSTYFPATVNNISALKKKSWIIVFDGDSWSYRFLESYSIEKKTPYSQISRGVSRYFTEKHKVQEITWVYHGYNFSKYNFYKDSYWAYESQLEASWFSYEDTILYKREDGSYNFVTSYDSYPIATSDDVYWVPEKRLFLDYLREDSKYESPDISTELTKIKNISKSLTEGKTREDWIKNIYNWILNNVEYSQNINLTDEKIFSWIEAFRNSSWVCTWYTKLSSYLFYFAGYYDVEVIRGYVIDARDFPRIWHAWLRIWDLYYDPTFDDPVGAKNTKTFDQYKYFGLPKDIFYANRFEYVDMPEVFKTASKAQIDQHIFNTLSNLIPKYKTSLDEYPVFAQINFKNKYNISSAVTITPDILASKLWNYSVENDSFTFKKSWKLKTIKQVRYYILSDQNTESVLDILWYDTDNFTLFDWETSSGAHEWRLSYELELH
jgi:hypothetical protein